MLRSGRKEKKKKRGSHFEKVNVNNAMVRLGGNNLDHVCRVKTYCGTDVYPGNTDSTFLL